jgi:predicted nucleic acid-binding protein
VTAPTTGVSAVVDTDVVSFIFRNDTRAERYRQYLVGRTLAISFMSVAELDRWALERNWGPTRRARLDQHIAAYVIQPFDRDLCLKWAEVTVGARRQGRPIQTADAWIAATALLQGLPLITHNRQDYLGVDGLVVLSES